MTDPPWGLEDEMLAGIMRRFLDGPYVGNDYVSRWNGFDEATDDYVRPLLCLDAEVALTVDETALIDRLLSIRGANDA